MVLKKYKNRPSPSVSANQHCGKTKRGNDGQMYTSKRNSRGFCQWKIKKGSRRRKTTTRRRKTTTRQRKTTKRVSKNKMYTSATINLGHSYGYSKKTEKFKKPLTKSQAKSKMKKYCKVDCFMEDDYSQGSKLIIQTGS